LNTTWSPTQPREILLSNNDLSREATATIASLSDQDWYVSRTYGVFHIPARPKDQEYAVLLINAHKDALDIGDSRRLPFVVTAREIAEDLLQDLGDHGVFVCAGARPTKEELAAAAERRNSWYLQLVADADQMWARGHSYREISDMHRRAVLSLGLEREWAFVARKMADCPACGEKVKEGVAVCKHCKAILDPEKAAQHGVLQMPSRIEEPKTAREGKSAR